MNKEFLAFNLNFDRAKLLRLWHEKYKSKARSWGKDYDAETLKRVTKSKSSEEDRDVFKVSKVELEEYPQTLMDLFGVKAKPRFFFLKANTVLPYHVDPNRELLEDNLMTLCEGPGNCHYVWGHLLNWKAYNPTVVDDTKAFLEKVNKRLTHDLASKK
jgi:hypothetical protein